VAQLSTLGHSAMFTLNPSLLLAAKWERGYTWTLTSRFGEMLYMAQDIFGPRDTSYTILGVEFVMDNPRIWYPGSRRDIIIQLSPPAAMDMAQACYQLAHETVHLLAPSGGNDAINFEEGVACYFSAYYMRTQFGQPSWHPSHPSYIRALSLVTPRLDAHIQCIRRLRNKHPTFSLISRDDLIAEFPALKPEDADFLLSRFDRAVA
jgi:hypothetical protein